MMKKSKLLCYTLSLIFLVTVHGWLACANALKNENEYCGYDHCVGERFFCATDGRDFQLFRNVCYMKWFNYCNRKSE